MKKMMEVCEEALGKEIPKPGDNMDLWKVRDFAFELARRVDELEERVFSKEIEWDSYMKTIEAEQG